MDSMQSNEERGAEKQMDEYLKSIGFHRKKIAKDGSCLFRAVAEQVLHCQSLHTKVRAKCVEFLKQNRESYEAFIEGDFEEYLFKLQDPQQWVGEVEISALAVMYKRDFQIFQDPGKPAVNITDNNFKDKVRLCFLNGNHYDSVYPISHIKNTALCQSVLYELLYDDVFKVDRNSLSVCQRQGRPFDLLIDDNMAACASSDESDTGEPLWVENGTSTTAPRHSNRGRGRGRLLSERVRRSLNPTLLRNIEYDVWHKTKRAQQKMDYCIAAGMQFSAGDRCQVRLEGRSCKATVKEVPPDNGPVTVYIEELGRRQVPLWSLRPPCDENSWSTVVNRDKRLSNGHGEWEERGKGRGRGKHVPASSSLPPAAAAGPSGRVQKQHSWPPQATVEEPGGAKSNRKSVSSAESAFGLTKDQRLAKEEEERNVALVEIQMRDEHSFPALGAQAGSQGDGGKKKGGEKRRSQRNKTKSPVEDVRAPSPSAGDRPKSSTPPLTAPTPPPTVPSSKPPAALSANSDSSPAGLSSDKASMPKTNMAAASTAAPSSDPTVKPSTSPPLLPLPPAAAPSSRPSVTGGALPSSATLFSFITPVLPAAHSPPTPLSSSSPPPSSTSSLPPKSSPTPPPCSSVPPPTFIAPIAPSPTAAQGFLHPSSLSCSSPPVSSLPHSPSPPSVPSSSSLVLQAAPVLEVPPVSAQSSLPNTGGSLPAAQTFQSQSQRQIPASQPQPQVPIIQTQIQDQPSLPQNQTLMPPTQTQCCLPHLQHQPQSSTKVTQIPPPVLHTSLPQNQPSVFHLQPQSQPQYLPQSQSEVHSSYPLPSQASVPISQHPVSLPNPHIQPPHPSQVPHPSLSLSTSTTHPQTQTQTEAPLPHAQPHSESSAHPPPLQSHPPHPSHHPQPLSAHPPPHPQSIPGAVPLQQLSQLYQDPLYPGFPQGEKGEVAPTPLMSSSRSGDDLPQDVNILRFFFNLGVKAYSMHMLPPYIYLFPLQQAHTMNPKIPSRSPSPIPHYPPPNPPPRHQEPYTHPQYPPASASMPPQYEHQAPPSEPPHPTDPSFNQAGYPITQHQPHRMPQQWQQPQMPQPRNPSFPVVYPSPSPPYPVPPPISQGYHPSQSPGQPLYHSSLPYPSCSMGYQSSSTPEELQLSQGVMEQHQPPNGNTMPGQRPVQVPGLLGSAPAANMANANSLTVVVPGFVHKKEHRGSLTRAVLLGEPSFNNNQMLVSTGDVPVSMTTMKPTSTTCSPALYDISETTASSNSNPSHGHRVYQSLLNRTYVPLGAPEHSQVDYALTSVGCSTEDNCEEQMGFKPATVNYRGQRRCQRRGGRGRGRGSHDPERGVNRRRDERGAGSGSGYVQFNSSHRGRGRE
uniref:OTU domain-containing protein 4 n=1 Tax=Semicossyphus pulcher TaxID=241346 RepID=UPI0037E9478D